MGLFWVDAILIIICDTDLSRLASDKGHVKGHVTISSINNQPLCQVIELSFKIIDKTKVGGTNGQTDMIPIYPLTITCTSVGV